MMQRMQALTAAGMAGASDLVAQRISSPAPINWRRTALMAVRLDTHTLRHIYPARRS